MSKKIIICGTGRCGTLSMKTLLESCKQSIATHEFEPLVDWNYNDTEFQVKLQHFNSINTKYVSDTGAWYLNYIEKFIETIPSIKVVILKRDKDKTIKSYIPKVGVHNFWNHSHKDGSIVHTYDKSFPDYGNIDIKEAIGLFWDAYYKKAEYLSNTYPNNVKIFNVELLNTLLGQEKIYNFIGIDNDDKVFIRKCRRNVILNL